MIDPLATAGVIYSPNFPWNYGNTMLCTWNITSPSRKMSYLNFTHFSLEPSYYKDICLDYVYVSYFRYSRKFCGSTIPFSIFTNSTSIFVMFSSDYTETYPGFMAFYQKGYTSLATTYPLTKYPPYTVEPTNAKATSRYDACSAYSKKSKSYVNLLISPSFLIILTLSDTPHLDHGIY